MDLSQFARSYFRFRSPQPLLERYGALKHDFPLGPSFLRSIYLCCSHFRVVRVYATSVDGFDEVLTGVFGVVDGGSDTLQDRGWALLQQLLDAVVPANCGGIGSVVDDAESKRVSVRFVHDLTPEAIDSLRVALCEASVPPRFFEALPADFRRIDEATAALLAAFCKSDAPTAETHSSPMASQIDVDCALSLQSSRPFDVLDPLRAARLALCSIREQWTLYWDITSKRSDLERCSTAPDCGVRFRERYELESRAAMGTPRAGTATSAFGVPPPWSEESVRSCILPLDLESWSKIDCFEQTRFCATDDGRTIGIVPCNASGLATMVMVGGAGDSAAPLLQRDSPLWCPLTAFRWHVVWVQQNKRGSCTKATPPYGVQTVSLLSESKRQVLSETVRERAKSIGRSIEESGRVLDSFELYRSLIIGLERHPLLAVDAISSIIGIRIEIAADCCESHGHSVPAAVGTDERLFAYRIVARRTEVGGWNAEWIHVADMAPTAAPPKGSSDRERKCSESLQSALSAALSRPPEHVLGSRVRAVVRTVSRAVFAVLGPYSANGALLSLREHARNMSVCCTSEELDRVVVGQDSPLRCVVDLVRTRAKHLRHAFRLDVPLSARECSYETDGPLAEFDDKHERMCWSSPCGGFVSWSVRRDNGISFKYKDVALLCSSPSIDSRRDHTGAIEFFSARQMPHLTLSFKSLALGDGSYRHLRVYLLR